MHCATLVLVFAGAALANERQPLVAYWVSHHDTPPLTGKPWEQTTDVPRLVAYDDGLVVVTSGQGVMSSVQLTPEERETFAPLLGDDFSALGDRFEATRELHPPVHTITRWSAGARKSVRLFGAPTEAVPVALRRAVEALASWKHPSLAPFVPDTLLVRACRTAGPSVKARWPTAWPDPATAPSSPETTCVTVQLPGSERARSEALVRKPRMLQHGSAAWFVTLTRFGLPNEAAWANR